MYLLAIFLPIINVIFLNLTINFFSSRHYFIQLFLGLILTLILSIFILYEVVYLNSYVVIELNSWITLGTLVVKWSFFFDKLSTMTFFLIIFISLLVHFFAYDYLRHDPFLIRFLTLLTIFTTFMLILATAGTTLQLFLGWEGVGLMSYLLINFWFTRYFASNSGLMAIIYNRVGDVCLLLGIILIFLYTNSFNLINIFLLTEFLSLSEIKIFSFYYSVIDLISILLFIAAIAKSAQIFLESWLSQAMEGPTPVSSLLHASTMIISGVFLLQRFQILVVNSNLAMFLIILIGGLTAFFAGTVGLITFDLKKIIAYSTCSQMGYLVFCYGISKFDLSLFHLVNHAFFKCLLFVGAGSIIHSFFNEQDIRLFGGLFKLLPYVWVVFFFASLSLMGIPFLSGFYSKEKILESSYYCYNSDNLIVFWLGNFAALLTAVYSIRLIYYTFFNKPNNFKRHYEIMHLENVFMLNLVFFFFGSRYYF